MNGAEILLASIKFNHQLTGAVCGDCTPETLAKPVGGSTINTAGTILAHAVLSEDFFVQAMMKHEPLIFASGGWAEKTGIPPTDRPMQTPEFASGVKLNMATFTPYMQAVFAATEAYIGGLSDADLDQEVDGLQGKTKLGLFLAGIGVFHLSEHLGEISALKGVHGLKGLPF